MANAVLSACAAANPGVTRISRTIVKDGGLFPEKKEKNNKVPSEAAQ
jgi:hypothetical protein